jgi:hypothetical protein
MIHLIFMFNENITKFRLFKVYLAILKMYYTFKVN